MQLPWANPVRTECTDPFSVCHLLPPSQAPSTTAGWSPTADTVRHAAPLLLCTMNAPAAGGVGGTGDGGGGGGDGDGDGDGDGFVELHCDSDCACWMLDVECWMLDVECRMLTLVPQQHTAHVSKHLFGETGIVGWQRKASIGFSVTEWRNSMPFL